jgi:hypothetical protein
MVGQGTFYWFDGDKYTGEYKDGKDMVKEHTLILMGENMRDSGKMLK